jgi:hypothetical protein
MSGERGNPLLKRVDRWLGIPLVMSLGAARALVRRARTARLGLWGACGFAAAYPGRG